MGTQRAYRIQCDSRVLPRNGRGIVHGGLRVGERRSGVGVCSHLQRAQHRARQGEAWHGMAPLHASGVSYGELGAAPSMVRLERGVLFRLAGGIRSRMDATRCEDRAAAGDPVAARSGGRRRACADRGCVWGVCMRGAPETVASRAPLVALRPPRHAHALRRPPLVTRTFSVVVRRPSPVRSTFPLLSLLLTSTLFSCLDFMYSSDLYMT